ncbi:hypothetical protein ACFL03_09405 [Thermodesulfobacteriota bacterium]
MNEHFDAGSLTIILITFILFVLALFTKGFTHDLLLEAGVFLVSVKLIIMAYKNSMASKEITKELHTIKKMLEKS